MRRSKLTSALGLSALAITLLMPVAPVSAADYLIDEKGAHASINFRVKHLGFSWLTGRFDKFSGTFSYDEAKPEASKIRVEIDVASLNSNHAERDKHLRANDFLDVANHPTAVFESTSVTPDGNGKAKIAGKLTLRGVTKDIVIDAEHIGGGNDPWGGFRNGFAGKVSLPLKDYGIPYDLGPASQEVELDLNVEGIRQ
ncbi:MAG: YceI family protein [Hyphomicrobiaceae bacterium]